MKHGLAVTALGILAFILVFAGSGTAMIFWWRMPWSCWLSCH